MGNDDSRAAAPAIRVRLQQPGNRSLQALLGDEVEPRGRLVENDKARIFEQQARESEQLRFATYGDPINDVVPRTSNVGKMQQYTNMLQACVRFAPEVGMTTE